MADDTDTQKVHTDEDQNGNGGLDLPEGDTPEAVKEDEGKQFDYGTGDSDEGTVPVAP